MPLYEYECDACGHRFEVIQKFSDSPLTECPKCQGAVRKLPSSPAIQFKGSGFYITDYAKKGGTASGSAKSEGSGSSASSSSSEGAGQASAEKSTASPSTDTASKTDSGTKATKPSGT